MVKDYSKQVQAKIVEWKTATQAVCNERKILIDSENEIDATKEARDIIQTVAREVQQQAHIHLSQVVTRCLQLVFDQEAYEFHIEFEKKRGRTEARLQLLRNGMVLDDPINESGGGVIDVAAFALRLSCLMIQKPKLRRILFLDEPFKFLSEEYRPRIRDMLMELSKEMRVQFVIITHIPELICGKVIHL